MKEESAQIRFLIGLAFLLAACILVYRLFYIPDAVSFSDVWVDSSWEGDGSRQEESVDSSDLSIESGGKIPLNTADAQELQKIPGIGPVTAEAIVEHREKNGPFLEWKELLEIPGIGEKTYDLLLDWTVLD